MNAKRFILSFLVVFVFTFLFGWLYHGVLLKPTYAQAPPGLIRPEAEFMQHFQWLVLGQVLIAFSGVLIFASFCKEGGVGRGLLFGILVGVFCGGIDLIQYAVTPAPAKFLCAWFVGDLVQYTLGGVLLGAIYRSTVPAPAAAAS